ncbi:MAG: class IV adenylate cyclase [Bryobacterales bacterium]|nr:class IV adenylate cyclase [Bryobacterales bacterium]
MRPVSLEDALARIASAGFKVQTGKAFESNTLFDTVDGRLRALGQILRLREFGGESVLTFKGKSLPGKHKVREELETVVGTSSQMLLLLNRLGFQATFRYEKYRAVYARAEEPGLLTVDETPIGPFLELEGSADWIDRAAMELGYSPEAYITESYGQLWQKHCAQHGMPLTDFVFVTENGANG